MVFSLLRHLRRPRHPPGRVLLADIAESSVLLESCPARAARFAPADARREGAANPFLDWVSTPVGLTAHILRDVVYDVDSRVLLKGGKLVVETCYLQPPEMLAELRVDSARLIGHAGPGMAVPCSDHWPGNYYHWMTHALPVMAALSDRPDIRRRGRLRWLLPELLPWQRQTLDLLGTERGGGPALAAGRQYRLDRAVYCTIVAGAADFALSRLSQSVFPRMAARVPVMRRRGLRLYVDRGGAGNRAIPNEAALAAALAAEGFCVVRPERMGVAEQIDLFRAAAMVVGPLGAGMTNIGFCRPGTLVYELVPDHHANPCFLAMAMRGHLNYWADVYPTGATGQDHVARWEVGIDVARVLRRVSGLWSRGTRPVLVSDGAA
ncbi:glycosyltransferase family 61 protein [Gluconacetobacter takamatsuzukensis]|uniref:Glycosyltransferase family 61 protein n=2 Tax=Gluconacetobacter takamatsuzukensis TaxID=1286190 RepID=A0A7W4PNB2_9PROT|nr:glycosyltransferase family 61 protein [Gluconacetobacter takamatsuzukensis]